MKPYKRKKSQVLKEPLVSAEEEVLLIKEEIIEEEYWRNAQIDDYEWSDLHWQVSHSVEHWLNNDKYYNSYWKKTVFTPENIDTYPNAWEAYKITRSKLWKVLS